MGRISLFNELVFEFSLPFKNTLSDCAAFNKEIVYVLLSDPVQIFAYDSDFKTYSLYDLSSHLPYHKLRAAKPRLYATKEGFVLFLPVYRMLLSVDVSGAFITPYQIPSLEEGDSGPYNESNTAVFNDKLFPNAVTLRGGTRAVGVSQECGGRGEVFVVWAVGGRGVAWMDLRTREHSRTELLFDLASVVSVREGLWTALSQDGRMFLLHLSAGQLAATLVECEGPTPSLLSCCPWSDKLFSSEQYPLITLSDALLEKASVEAALFRLEDQEGAKVTFSLWISHTRQLLVGTSSRRLLILDPEKGQWRKLCEEEVQHGAVCASELRDGRVFVAYSDGRAGVYDTDWKRLETEEGQFRAMPGLSKDSAEGEEKQETVGVTVRGAKGGDVQLGRGDGRGSGGQGQGSGGGAGSGGGGSEGSGSGGTGGSGSGGRRGSKREQNTAPPTDDDVLTREIDEAQRAMARKALEEELAQIEMGRLDMQEYQDIVKVVESEIEQLRNLLVSLA